MASGSKLEGKQTRWLDAAKRAICYDSTSVRVDCLLSTSEPKAFLSADANMPKQLKLDLQREQQKVRRFIERRIRDYSEYVNLGPGEDQDPVSLITIGFYAAQGGYVSLVIDTRPDAGPDKGFDGEWTQYLENETNVLSLTHWCQAFEALSEGQRVVIVRHDFLEQAIVAPCGPETINAFLGDMLVDLAMKMRNQGWFARLPLASNARIAIEEFDGYYFWPNPGKKSFSDAKTQALVCTMGRLT